jgi:hypothetical protein
MKSQWIPACAAGQGLSVGAVMLAYAAVDREIAGPELIAFAGALGGLLLGLTQAAVLAALGVRQAGWVAATVAASLFGNGVALIVSASFPAGGEPPLAMLILLAIAAGGGMGPAMALLQWTSARRVLPLKQWLGLNALGWGSAMGVIAAAAASLSPDASLGQVAASGIIAGALAGTLVGVAGSLTLPQNVRAT